VVVSRDTISVHWSNNPRAGPSPASKRIPFPDEAPGALTRDGARCCQVLHGSFGPFQSLKCVRSTSRCGEVTFSSFTTFRRTERTIACLYIQRTTAIHHNRTTSPTFARRCCLAHLHPKSLLWPRILRERSETHSSINALEGLQQLAFQEPSISPAPLH
jgi:hypothetical protein